MQEPSAQATPTARISYPQKIYEAIFGCGYKRYRVFYGGRGGAKTWNIARALLDRGMEQPLRILCCRETQNSIEESVYQTLVDQIDLLGLRGFYRVQANEIHGLNGTKIIFKGIRQQSVANLKSLEGTDICWVEEAQVVTKKSWNTLTPTIRKPDSEIWITFNPELDTDETWVRFVENPPPDAVVVKLTYADNPWFPEVLERERLAFKARDPISYENVWEGSCRAAAEGAIYANEIAALHESGRIRAVPADPLLRVHTIHDIGWNDKHAILFVQRQASEIRIIDYFEDSHLTLADVVRVLDERGYRYGSDFLPHDAAPTSQQTGLSTQVFLKQLGRADVRIVPEVGVEEGIKAARLLFPRTFFDKERTRELIGHLKRYRRAVPQSTGEPGRPVHDAASHGADAFRYLAVVAEQLVNTDTQIEDPYRGFRRAS